MTTAVANDCRVMVNRIWMRRNPYLVELVPGGRFAWHSLSVGAVKYYYVGLAYGRTPQGPDGVCNGKIVDGKLIARATASARWIRIFADVMLVRIARESTNEEDAIWATTSILECKRAGTFTRFAF